MEKISGIIESVIYSSTNNDFKVVKIYSNENKKLITISGYLPEINIGNTITVTGNWKLNKEFGREFSVTNCEIGLPSTEHEMELYLGSGALEGVGPALAKSMVKFFGDRIFDIIENDPKKLLSVPKIGPKKLDVIIKSWDAQKDSKDLLLLLNKAGLGTTIAQKIFKVYGKESISKIKDNPYDLIYDIKGINFKIADSIAKSLNFGNDFYRRCEAGIIYILESLSATEGHCYIPSEELAEKCSKILEVNTEKIKDVCENLIKEKIVICEEDKIYLPIFYNSEIFLAKKIKSIMDFPVFLKYSKEENESEINKVEKDIGINYDDSQKEAINTVLSSNFSVITGGAGVGKTTITEAIINIFKNRGKDIILTAPTGRAAKRLSEISKSEAKTIHRLLEAQEGGRLGKNSLNKLTGNALIVDEASMVDIKLMSNLFKAIPDSMTVILIGDANQLPSVGPGNVLRDIIDSQTVPIIKLNNIYRQSKISDIIINSHKINQGEIPNLKIKSDSDFFFIENNNSQKCADTIIELYTKRLPNYYKVNPVTDIQVLSPMKRGILGTDNLNRILQASVNKNSLSLTYNAIEYKLKDKVMQIKNNYDKDIFNGDIGIISSINKYENFLEVNFDSKIVKYNISELNEITLAYACTIHKSQGGEYPIIIIPMDKNHHIMLERNLLYTAITRAKKVCVLIGRRECIINAVKSSRSKLRYTTFSNRLKQQFQTF